MAHKPDRVLIYGSKFNTQARKSLPISCFFLSFSSVFLDRQTDKSYFQIASPVAILSVCDQGQSH